MILPSYRISIHYLGRIENKTEKKTHKQNKLNENRESADRNSAIY